MNLKSILEHLLNEMRGYFAKFGQLEKYDELTGKNNKAVRRRETRNPTGV